MKQKVVLVITDGIGHSEEEKANAFLKAKKPNYDYLFKNCAHSLLKTSGLAVGLPEGQMGNSEVGHMCIGSGRILYQNLVKIDKAIEDNSLSKNEILNNLFKKCKRIHVIGLYSDGGVHSHLRHFDYICKCAKDKGCDVFAHPITDGRDVDPKSGYGFIKSLESKFNIATVSGRFYAMDRDKRWDRIEKAYNEIKKASNKSKLNPSEYIKDSYSNNITDEFIIPSSFGNFDGIKKDDGIVFINFRNDRAKELISALCNENFDGFMRDEIIKNTVTMTNYDNNFDFAILFGNDEIKNTLSDVISKANLRQLHTAETEKYAHVTFFFNGGKEEPNLNETRILIPSPKVKTYDEKPEMSAYEVCDIVCKGIKSKEDFIVVNFANGDMVGHTGNLNAAIKAVEVVDKCIGKILEVAKENNYSYIQVSDHGNCEKMKDENNKIFTSHTTFDVPCFVVSKYVDNIKDGGLANIAPTILKLMGLDIPKEMSEPLF